VHQLEIKVLDVDKMILLTEYVPETSVVA